MIILTYTCYYCRWHVYHSGGWVISPYPAASFKTNQLQSVCFYQTLSLASRKAESDQEAGDRTFTKHVFQNVEENNLAATVQNLRDPYSVHARQF